ncbi:MAG: ABC transporter ATP-binding protein [Spirochaetales bacterium]|nr:ABC transporter ATP-binding protein [Spirochaetales bacterium]
MGERSGIDAMNQGGDEGHHLLEVRNVSKRFGGLVANNNVSMEVREGEIRGLIGPNGSGKTTLLNIITGMYELTDGSVWYTGKRINGMKANVISSIGIMRTFQVARVFRNMTVLENMLIPALAQGLSHHEAEHKAKDLLDFALLSRLKDKPAKSLSGGQNMLLQIVRGFMNSHLRLYAMDEPFAGVHKSILDVIINSIRVMNREQGVTFLIVSHDMSTVSNLCDRITVLAKGERIAEGSMQEVANNPAVIDGYLGG